MKLSDYVVIIYEDIAIFKMKFTIIKMKFTIIKMKFTIIKMKFLSVIYYGRIIQSSQSNR